MDPWKQWAENVLKDHRASIFTFLFVEEQHDEERYEVLCI
jgi:hypothetical protein